MMEYVMDQPFGLPGVWLRDEKTVKNISFLLPESHIRGTLISIKNKGWKRPEQIKLSSGRLGHIFYS